MCVPSFCCFVLLGGLGRAVRRGTTFRVSLCPFSLFSLSFFPLVFPPFFPFFFPLLSFLPSFPVCSRKISKSHRRENGHLRVRRNCIRRKYLFTRFVAAPLFLSKKCLISLILVIFDGNKHFLGGQNAASGMWKYASGKFLLVRRFSVLRGLLPPNWPSVNF